MSSNLDVLAERMQREVYATTKRPARRASRPKPQESPKPLNLLTLEEAAAEMRVSLPTFRSWGVPRFKQGRIVYIRRQDLDAFIASRIVAGGE